MEEKISVIIPVYNAEKYLTETINCVLNQSYRNLEIILIDDGSTDDSASICNKFAEKDSRIVVIHKKNEGVSIARNTGIAKSTGEYIGFVDSDDIIDVDFFEFLLKGIKETNSKCVMCGYIKESELSDPKGSLVTNDWKVYGEWKELWSDNAEVFNFSCWNKLFARDIIKDIHFDSTLKVAEDLKFNYDIAQKEFVCAYNRQKKYHYIVRKTSVTKTMKLDDIISELMVKYEIAVREKRYIGIHDRMEHDFLLGAMYQINKCIRNGDREHLEMLKKKFLTYKISRRVFKTFSKNDRITYILSRYFYELYRLAIKAKSGRKYEEN